jgi:hypothetical protein
VLTSTAASPSWSRCRTGSGPKAGKSGENTAVLQCAQSRDVQLRNPAEQREHPIAAAHAQPAEDVRELIGLPLQVRVAQVGDVAAPVPAPKGHLRRTGTVRMAVDRLVGDVHPAAAWQAGQLSPGCCPGELLAGTRIVRKVRLYSQRFGLADRLPVHTDLPRRGAAVQLRFQRPGDRTGADRDESPTVCGQGAADSRSVRRIKRRRRSPPCRLQVLTPPAQTADIGPTRWSPSALEASSLVHDSEDRGRSRVRRRVAVWLAVQGGVRSWSSCSRRSPWQSSSPSP